MTNRPVTRSIASRTFRIVFYSTIISLGVSLGFAWWALETLEGTMLEAENRIEIEHFDQYGDKDKALRINTANMNSLYLPNSLIESEELPIVFQNIPVPFQGEVEVLGSNYVVITHAFAEGRYYLAKNIQLFEDREETFIVVILILSVLICLSAFALALLAGRYISGPVVRLTSQLKGLETENTTVRISTDFPDSELNEIATALNHFLDGLEDSIKRERTLISMASHELKTPVSVIRGAAQVIEARGNLDPGDVITLNRIIDASGEMAANIHALLNLARRSKTETIETCLWSELFHSIREDYQFQDPALAKRLRLVNVDTPDKMIADKVLVKMLLHNLIGNALNYTSGNVVVELHAAWLIVLDEGATATNHHQPTQPWQTSGLGLYIVDLLCKQLGWRYEIIPGPGGSCVKVLFGSARSAQDDETGLA